MSQGDNQSSSSSSSIGPWAWILRRLVLSEDQSFQTKKRTNNLEDEDDDEYEYD